MRGRLRTAALAGLALVGACVIAAPVLWLLGSLDEVEWGGDFVTGVVAVALLYLSIAFGFVVDRWSAVVLVWLAAVGAVLVELARWDDDPTLSGIDDLSPSILLPFTPLVMVLPVIGVGLARLAQRPERPRPPRQDSPLVRARLEAEAEMEDHDIDGMRDAIEERRRKRGARDIGEEIADELERESWDNPR